MPHAHVRVLTLLTLLLLAGCGGTSPSSSPTTASPAVSTAAGKPAVSSPAASAVTPASAAASKPAASASLTKMSMSYSPATAYSANLFVAAEQGSFRKYGYDVELTSLDSAVLVQAAASGSVPIALRGSTVNTINAISAGADLKTVASHTNSPGLVWVSKKDINSLNDLKGQTVAVSQPLSSSDFSARLVIQKNGLAYNKDIQILAAGSLPAEAAALEAGKVAAAIVSADLGATLQSKGYKILLKMADLHVPFNEGTLIVNGSFAKAQPAAIVAAIKASQEGVRDTLASYDVYVRDTRKYIKDLSDEALKANYDTMKAIFSQPENPRVTPESIQTILDLLSATDPKVTSLKFDNIVDSSFIAKIKAEGFFKPGECQGC